MTRILALLMLLLSSAAALAFDPFGSAGIDQHPDAQIPIDVAFRDENGAQVTLAGIGRRQTHPARAGAAQLPEHLRRDAGRPGTGHRGAELPAGRGLCHHRLRHRSEGGSGGRASLARIVCGTRSPSSAATGAARADRQRRPTSPRSPRRSAIATPGTTSIGQYAHVAAIAVLTAGRPTRALALWRIARPGGSEARPHRGGHRASSAAGATSFCCSATTTIPKTGRYGSVIWTAAARGGGAVSRRRRRADRYLPCCASARTAKRGGS